MRRRILLADDSVTIQKVIELTFMDEDYDVKAVSNGDEALAALPDLNPDFVIADVHMPGANGYEVCRRSKEARPHIPVLLLVGTFEPFDEAQARAAGADSFLKKPFDSQELLQRVQDLLAASGGGGATPEIAQTLEASETAPPSFAPFSAADPFPAAAEPFELLESQPFAPPSASSPFLEDESPFVLEDDTSVSALLPADEPLFDLESTAVSEPKVSEILDVTETTEAAELSELFEAGGEPLPALGSIDFAVPPLRAAGFAAPWNTPEPAPEERLGVPQSAAPLVDSLAETESRIEAPAPPSVTASHEPESAATPRETAPEPWSAPVEARTLPPTIPMTPPPFAPLPAAAPPPAPLQVGSASTNGGALSDADVDRIARRVIELLGDKAVRDVAWEVIPDLAEVVIRDRLRELESQVENQAG